MSGFSGALDTASLRLAVVSTFHTALANTADAATKEAIAQSFFSELGLRECDTVGVEEFMEKMVGSSWVWRDSRSIKHGKADVKPS